MKKSLLLSTFIMMLGFQANASYYDIFIEGLRLTATQCGRNDVLQIIENTKEVSTFSEGAYESSGCGYANFLNLSDNENYYVHMCDESSPFAVNRLSISIKPKNGEPSKEIFKYFNDFKNVYCD